MTLDLALIADDLTGALDTATPFAAAGLEVAVAVTPDGLDDALAAGASVVAVSTASRALAPAEAAARVAAVARTLAAHRPRIVFKKVDSRLKGPVGAEAHAVADVFGHDRLVVCPAIPGQERFVDAGRVVGRGVDAPIDVAAPFLRGGRIVVVADARAEADLDAVAASGADWRSALAVGAHGLGSAFARRLGPAGATPPPFQPVAGVLFALGTRDPITLDQIDALIASGRLAAVVDAPLGRVPDHPPAGLPALVRATGAMEPDATAVAARFGAGVAAMVRRCRPGMLMLGGGDTALSVLTSLGVRVLRPRGEIRPGMPWFEIATDDGLRLACSVKSGGFGDRWTLMALVADDDGRRVPAGRAGAA